MGRIGKCKKCKGELISSAIHMDNIIETKCKNCGDIQDVFIIPKKKQKLIREFEQEINRR